MLKVTMDLNELTHLIDEKKKVAWESGYKKGYNDGFTQKNMEVKNNEVEDD